MSTQAAQFEAQFGHEHEGRAEFPTFTTHVNGFNTGDGDNVVVLPYRDWGSISTALGSIDKSTNFVVTPELSTLDLEDGELPEDVSGIRSQDSTVEKRIKGVRKISSENPTTVFVIGTPMFNGTSNGNGDRSRPKPTNSSLFIRDGEVAAHTNQQFALGDPSTDVFQYRQNPGGRTTRPDVSGILGADLIGEVVNSARREPGDSSAILRFAETLIVSSGVTLTKEKLTAPNSTPQESLKMLAELLFQIRSDVRDIIVVDRSGVRGEKDSLTAHFSRVTA